MTGHRSTDGVRTYKKVKEDQFRGVSNVLQGNPKQLEKVEIVDSSDHDEQQLKTTENHRPPASKMETSPQKDSTTKKEDTRSIILHD